jgi:hypothetical protein|tara:strand:- start:175 stop:396 length:222 start_codon:yes stop_codon:yes gene_type:complete
MKWENTYKVFEVSKGPKVIIESLNTYGEEGWECSSMVTVAGQNIVVFLKRKIAEEEKVDKKEQQLSKLWSGGE